MFEAEIISTYEDARSGLIEKAQRSDEIKQESEKMHRCTTNLRYD